MKVKLAGWEKEVRLESAGTNRQEVFVMLATVNSGRKNAVDGGEGEQSRLKFPPLKGTMVEDNAWMVGSMSRTETVTSPKVTNTSEVAGMTILSAQMKSLAGSARPTGTFMDGNVHTDEFRVAFDETIATLCSVNGFFASTTSTFMNENDEALASPNALRRLIPLMVNNLSGVKSVGRLAKSNVKHESWTGDEKERAGHGLQT